MIESFVDLTYRGLPLGRRIKLTQVRPSTGYLELPMPMPVGTKLAIATDEGIVLEATVIALHEQVGGSDRVPGMIVMPELGEASSATASWWQARVALPELEPRSGLNDIPPRAKAIVRPRAKTVPQPIEAEPTAPLAEPEVPVAQVEDAAPVAPLAADHPVADDGKLTTVMDAVDQELLEQLSSTSGELERLTRISGEMPVVDDGKKTILMESVDVSALGLEHGEAPAEAPAEDEETNGSSDKRRKKRKTKQ